MKTTPQTESERKVIRVKRRPQVARRTDAGEEHFQVVNATTWRAATQRILKERAELWKRLADR